MNLGCGPSANLKSTNTHGTQHRVKGDGANGGHWLLCLDRSSVQLYSEAWTGFSYRRDLDHKTFL